MRQVSPGSSVIGYYDDSAHYGGTTRYLTSLIAGLDRSRFTPIFFAPQSRPWQDSLRKLDVDVITLGPQSGTSTATGPQEAASGSPARPRRLPVGVSWTLGLGREISSLTRLFRKTPVALLHSNNAGAEAAPIAARVARVPLVIATWHVDPTYDLFGERLAARYRMLENASMRCLHHAISVSEATKQSWVERCHLNAAYQSRVSVIHNGIDLNGSHRRRSQSEAKAALGIDGDTSLIGSLGRLDHAKGYEFLLRAFPEVLRRSPRARLVIAGRGPLEADLKSLTHSLGLDEAVSFPGFMNDAMSVLEALDVYVQPSLCEAQGLGILEASGIGLPVVASRVGGITETVVDSETGFLIPPRDAAALVAPLTKLISDPALRTRMGSAGRDRVEAFFTSAQMRRTTSDLYERLLAR